MKVKKWVTLGANAGDDDRQFLVTIRDAVFAEINWDLQEHSWLVQFPHSDRESMHVQRAAVHCAADIAVDSLVEPAVTALQNQITDLTNQIADLRNGALQ